MARAKKKVEQNLDSLMDILSNVVAVMILIAVVIVLNMKTSELALGQPVMSDPPPHAERLVFECKDEKITFLDVNGIDQQIDGVQKKFLSKTGSMPAARQLEYLLNNNDVGDENYRVKLDLSGGVKFVYEPRKDNQGESYTTFANPKAESAFRTMLNEVDPDKYWIYIVAHPSGWETLIAAKNLIKDKKIAMGWDLMAEDDKIIMSSSAAGRGTSIDQ
ncbi:MAG: hypothetical protein KDA42_07410 [Planctomycetales bacterium]|nr:hypothetical protein [Planctomycetales bacterium]